MPAKWSDEIAPFLTLCDEEGGWGGERKAAGSPNCSISECRGFGFSFFIFFSISYSSSCFWKRSRWGCGVADLGCLAMLMLEAVGRFQLLAFGIGDWESLG